MQKWRTIYMFSCHTFGNSLPKTSSLPEQRQLPNPTSNENEDKLIPCPYDGRINYERVWGANVPVMDYDIFKLHHPFSMLVAGPRGAGKSEFVKQLLFLKQLIITNPPERIVWFYGRHQHSKFREKNTYFKKEFFYKHLVKYSFQNDGMVGRCHKCIRARGFSFE